jgi:hypothetical protein
LHNTFRAMIIADSAIRRHQRRCSWFMPGADVLPSELLHCAG